MSIPLLSKMFIYTATVCLFKEKKGKKKLILFAHFPRIFLSVWFALKLKSGNGKLNKEKGVGVEVVEVGHVP